MISMRSDESYRESSELRCYSRQNMIFFNAVCGLVLTERKKSGQIDFWFYEQNEKSSGTRKTRVIPLTFYEKNTLNVKK